MTVLAKKVVVVPAVAAIEVDSFDLVDVQENYGYGSENNGRGRHNSVQANIIFPTDPPTYRNINVWMNDEYLAVRGAWTDESLKAKIKEILESE